MKYIKVYTIDDDGYIIGGKYVGENCELAFNDMLGEPTFGVGCHHKTGIEKPKTEEQLLEEEIAELKETIASKKLRDMDYAEELARLNEIDPI